MSRSDTSKPLAKQKNNNKKRPRSSSFESWKDLPAFLDASASVSATTFGARRLPEIKALWNAQQQLASGDCSKALGIAELQSGGGKTSARHLRRRTTSHQSRKRHRYPSSQRKRNDTNHNNNTNNGEEENLPQESTSRRARRKPARLRQQHETWTKSPPSSVRTTVVHWQMTHLWHAKRFHVHDNLFGWKVPLLHCNRGARAALRLARDGRTLLQDVTWRMQPVLVGGAQLDALVTSLQRICPALSSSSSSSSSETSSALLRGSAMGHGVLHEIDHFPRGALGPATWWICQGLLDSDSNNAHNWWFYFFVHPSIKNHLQQLLSQLVARSSGLMGPHSFEGGLACFQLRGKCSTQSLCTSLLPKSSLVGNENELVYDWDKLKRFNSVHTLLPHLTCIPVGIQLGAAGDEHDDSKPETLSSYNDVSFYIHTMRNRLSSLTTRPEKAAKICIKGNSVLLVSHSPPCDDPSLPQNAAVYGWDVFCDVSIANDVFLALTHEGQACAIGLVEESHLRLESQPPLPEFPRDFPDTVQGRKYWSKDCREWRLLHLCLTKGWGRVNVSRMSRHVMDSNNDDIREIIWPPVSTLMNEEDQTEQVVVVRDSFGKPFVNAISGSGCIPPRCPTQGTKEGELKKSRRNRRPVCPSNSFVHALPLSSEEAAAHQRMCQLLLQSLSLPALIRCHLSVASKGTIGPGHDIRKFALPDPGSGCDTDAFLLGKTVAGCFSSTRGRVHGIGFVGAARLLRLLSEQTANPHSKSAVAVPVRNGGREVHLKVLLDNPSSDEAGSRIATMSLLL